MNRQLNVLSVGEIKDVTFHVPSYQRGYRWERRQVKQLLEDILANPSGTPYYLQPIVVADKGNGTYDLIDGQQRMTTLFLIYQALAEIKMIRDNAALNPPNEMMRGLLENLRFSEDYNLKAGYGICYDTRKGSESFLKDIQHKDISEAEDNPDYLYLWHAYQEIIDWLKKSTIAGIDQAKTIAAALQSDVKIIWYEIDNNVDCWKKFADLNVGKIALTNSELIKALFMRSNANNKITENEKDIIVTQWDTIERELADDDFWYFLTNSKPETYQTRIDLLFNIISGKTESNDPYATFQYFNSIFENKEKGEWLGKGEWDLIYAKYQLLHDWYRDKKIYHRIGFLTTFPDKEQNLLHILLNIRQKGDMTNSEFIGHLESKIKNIITLPDQIESIKDLDYNKNYDLILKILTLLNILTMDNMKDTNSRYSFNLHKTVDGGWSLEHIHAQNSEELNRKEQWITWISLHIESLNRFLFLRKAENACEEEINRINDLQKEMQSFVDTEAIQSQSKFDELSKKFSETATSAKETHLKAEYKDEMANMALLGKFDNSALNNSVFDVKRKKITGMTETSYVPVCTQRVFMKLYGDQKDSQSYFWGDSDREAYIDVMEETLSDFLPDGYVTDSDRRKKIEENNQTSNNQTNEQ